MKADIGRRLKKLRTEKGLTQRQLASSVSGGLDYTYIGKIERGEQFPSMKILVKIGAALAVPLDSFFRDEDATAAYRCCPPEILSLAGEAGGLELLQALKGLHKEDIPLVREITLALNRLREAGEQGGCPAKSAREGLMMAAEKGASYRRKER